MITFLITRAHTYTVTEYLESWGKELPSEIRLLPYEELPERRSLGGGTYIFADLERLTSTQLALAAHLARVLLAARRGFRVLNDPSRVLRRYDLLRRLHEVGWNDFTVRRAEHFREVTRFPVFLRHDNVHSGPIGGLIRSRDKLRMAIARELLHGVDASKLLIVEYCDVCEPSGIYRKASAFRVGDRVFPTGLYFNDHWCVKHADVVDEEKAAVEMAFLRNPRKVERQVWPIYELANLEYGRIDYHVDSTGTRRVWEINTNPVVMHAPETFPAERLPAGKLTRARFRRAFADVDVRSSGVTTQLRWNVAAAFDIQSTRHGGKVDSPRARPEDVAP